MSTTTIQPVGRLVAGLRSAIDDHADWSTTAQLVADHLPRPDILTPEQRLGSPRRATHTLHVEPDRCFSITDIVRRPGRAARIHGTDLSRAGSSVRRSYDLPAGR